MYTLKGVNELILACAVWLEPKLDAIAENREADCIEGEPPVGHVESLYGVAQNQEGLDGGSCVVGHDVHMRFPVEAEV